MTVYQIIIHRTEYRHGYEDDETTMTSGPTYHSKDLAEKAKAYYNASALDSYYSTTWATICEIEVLNYFNEEQFNF